MGQLLLDLEFQPSKRFAVGKRIVGGLRYLDTVYKREWRSRINLERLDMGSSAWDLFGQLFGDYRTGCRILRLDPQQESARLGFNVMNPKSPVAEREFAALTQGWKEVLQTNPSIKVIRKLRIAA